MKEFSSIREIIENSAIQFKNNIAFKVKLKTDSGYCYDDITYDRLKKETEAVGRYLLANIKPGSRIAIMGKNSYRWILVYLSVLCIDYTVIPIDRSWSGEEVKKQLARAGADVIFYGTECTSAAEFSDVPIKICMDTCLDKIIAESAAMQDMSAYNAVKINGDKMSILLFTSGTTSESKAVMLSQRNITANIYGMSLWEDFRQTDVSMALLPFHHAFGMTQAVIFLSYGMCTVFCEGLRIAKCLTEYKVSVFVGVPLIVEGIYNNIIKKLKKSGKYNIFMKMKGLSNTLRKVKIDLRRRIFKEVLDAMGGNLRLIINGAAAIDPDVSRFFNDIGVTLVQGYGLSETSPVVAAENPEHIKYGSVGYPLPGIDVKIIDPDENNIGEIAVRGANVMLGYYNDEESTKKVFRDGYFLTGDMGYFDDDGYLYITGRKKNVIVLANGKNVFPEELEGLIAKSPHVKECLVSIKVEHSRELLCAKIVYNPDEEYESAEICINDYIKEINKTLVSYKQIREIELTANEMAKTSTGKIKR